MALTDDTQATKTAYSYSPYGETATAGESSDSPYQYTGRENDNTGLYYYRARYYIQDLKRFASEDPIGLEGGVNVFAYVRGSPLKFIDPLGLLEMYGNWGGRNWSGGASGSTIPQNPRPPIDSLDACFMMHDYCYASIGPCPNRDMERACDFALLQCMARLPSNTSDWPMPAQNPVYGRNQHSPTADWWRSKAEWWFRRKWQ